MAKTEEIQMYGINKFLSPFVNDLKKLYCDGIQILVEGKTRLFFSALIAFLADTLAAHFVGGFKCSMSFALRVCRSCMVTSSQLQKCFVEDSCTLRTADSYFEQCCLLCGPLQTHYSKKYGIYFMSVLEEAPGYSVINGLPHTVQNTCYTPV